MSKYTVTVEVTYVETVEVDVLGVPGWLDEEWTDEATDLACEIVLSDHPKAWDVEVTEVKR